LSDPNSKFFLHAAWDRLRLHFIGLRDATPSPDVAAASPSQGRDGDFSPSPPMGESRGEGRNSIRVTDALSQFAVTHDEIRSRLGETWDALTVSTGFNASISIQFPIESPIQEVNGKRGNGKSEFDESPRLCNLPTIAFEPADAVEILWHAHARTNKEQFSDTLRFWSIAAQFAREILVSQRYVPSIARTGIEYRSYWRAILDDGPTRTRLKALASAMPPACRALVPTSSLSVAEDLLSGFILRTVDAMVRRCMVDDELTHLLMSASAREPKPMLRWLKGLVGESAKVDAPQAECEQLREVITGWTSRVDSLTTQSRFITGFRLHAPADVAPTHLTGLWRLTIHAIDREDPARVLSAEELQLDAASTTDDFPLSDDSIITRLRAEIARAAMYFSPLSACGAEHGPLEATFSLSEAYFFLREAAPLLKSEGFTIWTPEWWTDSAPRPRMRLLLRPNDGQSNTLGGIGVNELVQYDWEVAVGEEALTRDELAALAESKEPLVRLRGRWMETAQAEIDIARKFIEERGSGSTTLFDVLRRCYLSDDFAMGVPFGGIRAQGWVKGVLDSNEASLALEELPPPHEFKGDLRPYQLRGLRWLAFMSRIGVGACLADDMGLGKTIQLIALLLHEKESDAAVGPTLLVGPMSLVGNWQRELQRFAPSLKVLVHHGLERLTGDDFVKEAARHDIVISTYALAHRDFDQLSVVQWRRVALDEAQCVKNPAAKQAAAVRMLPAAHRLALTGTPVENRLSELWSIMDFLNPGYLGTAADFRRRLAIPIERRHDTDHAARLRTLIRPFILRRLKNDPLVQVDLPPKMEMKVFCNLTREQAALYEAVVTDMLRRVSESEGIQRRGLILATLTKLKQICNHPVQFLGDSSELAERSGKCERLGEMLGEVVAEGDQALIFTQYREMGDLLTTFLKKILDCQVLFLHGGTSRAERDRLVNQFQTSDRAPLLILSLKAGGFGLNLTAAAHVFHFDRWWNPAVEDQATDRAHRIGQSRTVQVHKLVCIGTLEERIDAMLEQKRQLADQIIGSGEAWLTELSTDQFRDLITLSQEAIGE